MFYDGDTNYGFVLLSALIDVIDCHCLIHSMLHYCLFMLLIRQFEGSLQPVSGEILINFYYFLFLSVLLIWCLYAGSSKALTLFLASCVCGFLAEVILIYLLRLGWWRAVRDTKIVVKMISLSLVIGRRFADWVVRDECWVPRLADWAKLRSKEAARPGQPGQWQLLSPHCWHSAGPSQPSHTVSLPDWKWSVCRLPSPSR